DPPGGCRDTSPSDVIWPYPMVRRAPGARRRAAGSGDDHELPSDPLGAAQPEDGADRERALDVGIAASLAVHIGLDVHRAAGRLEAAHVALEAHRTRRTGGI